MNPGRPEEIWADRKQSRSVARSDKLSRSGEIAICKMVAEWLGWEVVLSEDGVPFGTPPGQDQAVPLPRYTEDRNALNDVITALRRTHGPEWYDFEKVMWERFSGVGNCMQASPAQVCVIILNVVGKFKGKDEHED